MPGTRSLAERSRRPNGLPSSPTILLSGEDFSGKSFESALLTASDKVGPSWYTQLGETDGDQYGAIVDSKGRKVRYELVETDGTWPDIIAAINQVNEAAAAYTAEHPDLPPVHIFDSATIEWELLTNWTHNRARSADKAKKALAEDPNADIDVGRVYWNAANRRHNNFMTALLSFPGIVILTARGKWVSPTGKNGQPIAGAPKEYTLDAQKSVGFRSTVWVRMSREERPVIVGARRANGGIRPGEDRPLVIDGRRNPEFKGVDFSLEWLIFDWLGYKPGEATMRKLNEPVPGDEPDLADVADAMGISLRCAELRQAIAQAGTGAALRAVWPEIATAVNTQQMTIEEGNALRGDFQDKAMALGMGRAEKAKANEPAREPVAA